ncbi:crossover suppressor on 2 of Manheim isoform 1-T1 [Glossina fuscipes fuscipes]
MNLITPFYKGPFVASWLAAANPKYYDTDVDVVELCNKLLLTFDPKISIPFEGKERRLCSIKQENVAVPFRMFSRLFYGTLKIYQRQVDNLLKSTESLLKVSGICGAKIIKNPKRKSADLYHGGKNKRRRFLAKSQTSKGTFLTTNYNYLFDDMENLTKQTLTDSISEISTYLESSQFTEVRQVTQLQIREFTVREINTQTYFEVPELGDDYGFGEIIDQGHQGLNQINKFISNLGNEIPTQNNGRICKRKSECEHNLLEKQRYLSFDSDTESFPLDETIVNALASPQRSIGRKTLENCNKDDEHFQDANATTILHSQNCNGRVLNRNNTPRKRFHDEQNKMTNVKKKARLSKLIIDECIKLNADEMRKQIQNFDIGRTDSIRASWRQKMYLKNKKQLNAEALLTRFNKRSINMILNLKRKICLEGNVFREHYLSLIRSILKTKSPEDYATEIYAKWQAKRKVKPKTKCQKNNENSLLSSPQAYHFMVENDNNQFPPDDINNNLTGGQSTGSQMNREDWQAYGVIIKLLEIWRYSSKIDAINFCLTPKYRNHKALAFHSLLFLAAEQFIEITKRINSLEMDEIKLGRLSEKLINAHYHIK